MLTVITSLFAAAVLRPATRAKLVGCRAADVNVNVVPLPSYRLHFDLAAVALDDAVADGQPKPDAWPVSLVVKNGSKICGQDLGGNSACRRREPASAILLVGSRLRADPRLPPCGMASMAFITSASTTCSICAGSQVHCGAGRLRGPDCS